MRSRRSAPQHPSSHTPAPTRRCAVENGKTFEELATERAIEQERYLAADPTNSVHQMWEFDRQTMLAVRPKK